MAGDNTAVLAKIAAIKTRVLEIQTELANSGMSQVQETAVDDALTDLKTTVDPVVQNPPGTPPDPGLPTP